MGGARGQAADRGSDLVRVVHLTAPATVGGSESVVAALTAGMAARGHDVRIIALLGPGDRCLPFEAVAGRGVGLTEVRLPARSYRREIDRVVTLLNEFPPSVVHCHGGHADLVGLRAGRRVGLPLVSTAHGFVGGAWKSRLYDWIDRQALRRFDAVVAVSKPLADGLALAGVARPRIHVVPNALPGGGTSVLNRLKARQALGLAPEGTIYGWVGRLSHEKGPDVFIRALPSVAGEWTASFLGDGPMGDELRHQAAALGVAARIRWHGVVPDAGRLLAAFDVLVLSSRTEGTPMVILEAMAARVPLVVTAVGGVPDVLSDHEAILVPPEAPDALAAALGRVAADPGPVRERLVRASARLAADYSPERWLDRHEALYRRLSPIRH